MHVGISSELDNFGTGTLLSLMRDSRSTRLSINYFEMNVLKVPVIANYNCIELSDL